MTTVNERLGTVSTYRPGHHLRVAHPNAGKHLAPETRAKIAAANRARRAPRPALVPQLCACGCGEYAAVDEKRNRVSKYVSGHNGRVAHGMAGRTHSAESRAKIKAKRAKQGPTRSVRTPSERSNYSTWRSWTSMLWRIDDPTCSSYPRYGGRGITVCEQWRSFENFLADMGPRPIGTTLDRLNNDRDYEPGNCRWATRAEQEANKSNPWDDPVKRARILAGQRRAREQR